MGQRLAVFSVVGWAFATLRDWAASAGHEVAIVVTVPGTGLGPGITPSMLGGDETVLMSVPRVEICEAAVRDLEVDLGIVFTFRPVPVSLAAIPRHGMVNLHPSLLPSYRGPNGLRALYQGEPRLGATLHRLTSEFDAGPILAHASEATPDDIQPVTALEILQRTATYALNTGVPRALAGERGRDQDPSAATAAARFSEDETVLEIALDAHTFQCRFSALSLSGHQPRVSLDGEPIRCGPSDDSEVSTLTPRV